MTKDVPIMRSFLEIQPSELVYGRHGHRLNFNSHGKATCPESGFRYLRSGMRSDARIYPKKILCLRIWQFDLKITTSSKIPTNNSQVWISSILNLGTI